MLLNKIKLKVMFKVLSAQFWFMIQNAVYTRFRKGCVVNLCPYVPVNDSDERPCYSTLLIHIPWPWGGEEEILRGYESAVECLYNLKLSDDIPQYVNYTLELLHNSNVIRYNVGVNINEVDEESDEFLYNNCSDENNFIVEESNLLQIGDTISMPFNPNNNNIDSMINITAANTRCCKNFIQNVQK